MPDYTRGWDGKRWQSAEPQYGFARFDNPSQQGQAIRKAWPEPVEGYASRNIPFGE